MPVETQTKPVKDTVPKVNNEIAVGSDLAFQRKWWRFTRTIWVVFTCIIIADLLGLFGRGYFSSSEARSEDGLMNVKYERVERFSSPSILRVEFGANAIHDGKIELWMSDSLLKPLGNQRVIPQPQSSIVGGGGIQYTFPATTFPVEVEFALEPMLPGVDDLTLRVAGGKDLKLRIYVMP